MSKQKTEWKARTVDGAELTITGDGFHYRAYNKTGVQVDQPFIKLDDLLKAVGGELIGGECIPCGKRGPGGECMPGGECGLGGELPGGEAPADTLEGKKKDKIRAGGRDKSVRDIEPKDGALLRPGTAELK